ncbi:MAG: DNA polymerase III subunit beta [Acidimicrobiia bacterium]|nr:DNA polymerase III subunit beta [Acidimicrobiia bacterium]
MKFRCERDVIVEALGIAGRAVTGRGGMPGLSGVRAELVGDQLTLTGSDLDLTISVNVTVAGESDGVVVVPARLVTDIVRALPPGAVQFAAEDESLSISAGRSDFSIRLITGDEFPQMTELGEESVQLSSEQLTQALKQVVLAASTDDSRPVLTGVLLAAEADGLRLVSTDSFRLAWRDVAGASVLPEGQSVLIPSRALGELNRVLGQGDTVDLKLGEREASFEVGDVRLVTRLIEGNFPDYRVLVPESHPNVLTVNRSELMDALRRVKLLARESTPIRLEISDGSVELVAITQDVGTARESVEAKHIGSDLTIAFNPDFLLDGIDVAPGEEVTLSTIDELKPAIVRSADSDEFLYLIMPVRVS